MKTAHLILALIILSATHILGLAALQGDFLVMGSMLFLIACTAYAAFLED